MRPLTRLYRAYRLVTLMGAPLAWWIVSRKLKAAQVPAHRMHERLGHASAPRPAGRLLWLHAVSVGESLSVLALIARLGNRLTELSFLITSGTPTSADLIARRMPPRTRHQFAPLDVPGAVDRFYRHWRPDAGIFVESELWPNLLVEAQRRHVPLALLNARLSSKSVEGWRKWPDTAALVLDGFAVMLTQNRKAADDLVAMGADQARVRVGVNLKSTSDPLPVDRALAAAMETALGERPVWIAASTHPGEEEVILDAHRRLLARHPGLCLILVPRHPERGAALASMIDAAGLSLTRRSLGQMPDAATQVYLADTLGEVGTWYALSGIVLLGGSLRPIGGHNPFEPAQAGAAILTGPHVANFEESFAPLIALGGALTVATPDDIAQAVDTWLTRPDLRDRAAAAATGFAGRQEAALESLVDMICDALALDPDHA